MKVIKKSIPRKKHIHVDDYIVDDYIDDDYIDDIENKSYGDVFPDIYSE